jgi:uncharacterized protein YbcV (DUF1398 family)
MDSAVVKSIRQVWQEVHSANGLPFPQTVQKLSELGVERYHVDYTAGTITAYVGRDVDVAPVSLAAIEGTPEWSADKIKESVRQVQSGSVSYSEFSKGVIDGGVTNYWAFLAGKWVIYMGRYGDFHTEWFPGAKKD